MEGCFEAFFTVAFWLAAACVIAGLAVVAGGAIAGIGFLVGFGETLGRFSLRFVGAFWVRVSSPVLVVAETETAARGYFFGPGFADIQAAVAGAESGRRLAGSRFAEDPEGLEGVSKYSMMAWNLGGTLGVGAGDLVGRVVLQLPALLVLAVSGLAASATAIVVRGGQRALARFQRVGYSCTNDGCYARGLEPVYACPTCGVRHEHLWPGKHGVFTQTCGCGSSLPTLAVLGRRKLAASCRACGGALQGGETSDVHLVVVGGAGSGRTRIALNIVDRLISSGGTDRPALVPANPAEFSEYRMAASSSSQAGTPRVVVLAQSGERLEAGHSLYLYDAPAEFGIAEVAEQAYYSHIDAIILVISAKQVLQSHGSALTPAAATQFDLDELYGRVLKTFDMHAGQSAAAIRQSRMALLVAGADSAVDLAIAADSESTGRLDLGKQVRGWLVASGEGNFVRLLESDFKQVRYFVTADSDADANAATSAPYLEIVEWLLSPRGFSKWGLA